MKMVENGLKEEPYARVCPKCASAQVWMDQSNPLQSQMGLPPTYVCSQCCFSAYIFPEVPVSQVKSLRAEAKKEGLTEKKEAGQSTVDTRYGGFEVRVVWKIFGPILVLAGILLLFKALVYGILLLTAGLALSYVTFFKKKEINSKKP